MTFLTLLLPIILNFRELLVIKSRLTEIVHQYLEFIIPSFQNGDCCQMSSSMESFLNLFLNLFLPLA